MATQNSKPAITFGLGLFFGLLIGVFATIALSPDDEESTVPVTQTSPHATRAPQAQPPGPATKPPGMPPQQGAPPHGGQQDRAMASIAKVHFMKKFLSALTSMPQNAMPSPGFASPLADPSKPLRCADCHDAAGLNMDAMIKMDPGAERVEGFRRKPGFMIPLMENWVKRLNERHGDRLREPVTCRTCHAVDPREKNAVLPPLMASFVLALREKPRNANPAANWKPLLKDTAGKEMLCSSCHGEVGTRMEQGIDFTKLTRPAEYADDKAFMVQLMEEWVGELNRNAADKLVKAVVCVDCHDADPRR